MDCSQESIPNHCLFRATLDQGIERGVSQDAAFGDEPGHCLLSRVVNDLGVFAQAADRCVSDDRAKSPK